MKTVASCSPSGAGNFNTHGHGVLGHYRGHYGTVVYQEPNNKTSPCQSGSTYCFEAILKGQTN